MNYGVNLKYKKGKVSALFCNINPVLIWATDKIFWHGVPTHCCRTWKGCAGMVLADPSPKRCIRLPRRTNENSKTLYFLAIFCREWPRIAAWAIEQAMAPIWWPRTLKFSNLSPGRAHRTSLRPTWSRVDIFHQLWVLAT